ncbi:hypothetical protein G7B40_039365 [Aetokthonos hydrillicola Thurmond2011]|jgi:hypothetical protein|uniref:Cyclic GMP-AMP synthase n=1 Tax=Aetokthonos hydrillicola Thurmond2011 TaxID=2712845 RepID=A0AAP5IH94_9CYAN|nr:hypothetical protein [Aetokthonos hydrillicola]MBO3463971.1 hypothetical protein [Aetokthonos hydrillicola CCALA 1050]MBW4591151.1 hypothetical protein [Aetokthonos hydrillicola CCALA 1050]MDR9900552.1 hypothetical protein [Aetokthonos hydrillicola Thurmond2011]
MGIAASLFYSISTDKQTLHRRIIPTDEQREAQQQRWNDLADYLKAELKIRSGYSIYSWLQGSYKFATQLRPLSIGDEFDIDLGIYFQWQGKPHQGSFSPLQLKTMVQECMELYAQEQDDIKKVASPKMRCNRLHYKGDFHRQVFTPTIFVTAERKKPLFGQTNNWNNVDFIGPIPKDCSITFKLMNSAFLPPNSTVEWTVRNEGAEAEINNDLGHPAGKGLVATERSSYKGTHYMDFVVRQYGRVIGVKRVKVIIK